MKGFAPLPKQMVNKRLVFLSLVVALMLLTSNSYAQTTYTWFGSTNTSWGTSTNWSPTGIPGSSDYIIIQATGAYDLTLTTDKTIERYRINSGVMDLNGYTLTVNDKVEIYGGITETGKILQNATNLAKINNATVKCKLDLIATTLDFQYSTFEDSVKVKRTSSGGSYHWRGNKFLKHLDVENTSTGNLNMGYNPPDSCFDGLTMRGRRLRAAYQHTGSYVKGDVTLYDTGESGTSMSIPAGPGSGVYIDGDIIINKSGSGTIALAGSGTTSVLTQTSGKTITEGASGFTEGLIIIKGLVQEGSGGGVYLNSGADDQELTIETADNGPIIGELDIDMDDVTLIGVTVNDDATVTANDLTVTDNLFEGAASIIKAGITENNCGGNIFNGATTIKNTSDAADFNWGYANPDTFNVDLTVIVEGDEGLYMSDDAQDNYYGGNVSIQSNGSVSTSEIVFGDNAGTSLFKDTLTLSGSGGNGVIFSDNGSVQLDSSAAIVIGESGFLSDNLLFNYVTKFGDNTTALTRIDSATIVGLNYVDLDGDVLSPDSAILNIEYSTFRKDLRATRVDNHQQCVNYGVTDMTFYPVTGPSATGEPTGGNIFYDSLYVTSAGGVTEQVLFGYSTPDTCYGHAVFRNKGYGLYVSTNTTGNYYAGDVHMINESDWNGDRMSIQYYGAVGGTLIGGNLYVSSIGGTVYLGYWGGLQVGEGSTLIAEASLSGSSYVYLRNLEFLGSGPEIQIDSVSANTRFNFINSTIRREIKTLGTTGYFTVNNSEFWKPVDVISGRFYSVNSVYHEDVKIVKNKAYADLNGGNRFEKGFDFTLAPQAYGHSDWAYAQPDTFLGNVALTNSNNSKLILFGYDRPVYVGGDLKVYPEGNDIRMGMNFGAGELVFCGSNVQRFHHEAADENYQISRMKIDKLGGKVLASGKIEIQDTLKLTNGVIEMTDTSRLTLLDDMVIIGGSDSSHVDGPIVKEGNDAFEFPLGDNNRYRPLTITAPTNTSDEFIAEYRDKSSNGRHRHKYRDTTIHTIDSKGYWVFDRGNGSSIPEVTLGWDSLNCGVSDTAGLFMVGWGATDTAWVMLGKKNLTGDTISGELTNLSSITFGELAIGSDTLNDLYCPYDPYEDCPLPKFSFTSGCIGNSIQFTDLSTGDMTGAVYSWNFDDPFSSENYSSLTDPQHTFVSGGPFYVTLNIQGLNGCDLTYVDTINMDRQLPLGSYFHSNVKEALANEDVSFWYTGDALAGQEFDWNMGDGTSFNAKTYSLYDTISYSFDTAGVYFVKFYHYSSKRCKGLQTIRVDVKMLQDECIIADFGASVTCVDEATQFSDRSVGLTENANYYWVYSSQYRGMEVFSTERSPSFTFGDEGPYHVSLSVIHDNGCKDLVTKRIHFKNELRDTTDLEYGSRFVETNDDITFTLDGPIIDEIYELDLGDGTETVALDSFPINDFVHDYNVAGLYDVELTHGDSGCLSVRKYRVFVDDPSGSCPTVEAGSDLTLAFLEEYSIGGAPTISGGSPPFVTEWFPETNLDDEGLTNPTATMWFGQEYVVQVDDNNGCANFDSMKVNLQSDLLISTEGFDTILDTYEKVRYSVRADKWAETQEAGLEKGFDVGLPNSGYKEVRLLFFIDPTEVMAKISLELNTSGNISNVKLIETDAISGAETKVSLGDTYFVLNNPGGIAFNSGFAERYLNKGNYVYIPAYYYCSGELSRNFQEIRGYGENGTLISKQRQYLDQLGRPVQGQSSVLSNHNTLATQIVTDAFGRSSIQSLTAPTGQPYFCYKDDFMEAADGVPYAYEHFDTPINTTHPTVIVSGEDDNPKRVFQGLEGSLGHYYSNANQNEAFVRHLNTRFQELNTTMIH